MKKYLADLFDITVGARRFIITEAFFGLSVGIFTMLLNLHLLALNLNEKKIGEILSTGNLVVGFACIPAVLLANRFGRKMMLSIGAAFMSAGYFLYGFNQEIWALYFAQIILSCGITFVITTEIQLLFSYCRSKSEETKCYNLIFATFTLFVGVGTLIGGYLPQFFSGFTTSYQGPIFCASFILFITCILRGTWLPIDPIKEKLSEVDKKLVHNKDKNRLKQLILFSIFAVLSGMSSGWILSFLNIIIKFRLNWPDEKVSYLLSMHGFFLFAGSIFVPYLFHRFGISKSFAYIFITNIILAFLLSLVLPNSLLIVCLLIRGGLTIMMSNMIAGQSMSAIKENDRNLFAGLWSIAINLGISITTFISGIILNEKNYQFSFLCSGILIGITFFYFYYWIKPILDQKNVERQENFVSQGI